jgi:hypothetical protein
LVYFRVRVHPSRRLSLVSRVWIKRHGFIIISAHASASAHADAPPVDRSVHDGHHATEFARRRRLPRLSRVVVVVVVVVVRVETIGFYKYLSLGIIQLCCDRRLDFALQAHYFHRGQTMTGRLSSNTNTEEGTLTQESGDVRSVEGEVCGAVLVDE